MSETNDNPGKDFIEEILENEEELEEETPETGGEDDPSAGEEEEPDEEPEEEEDDVPEKFRGKTAKEIREMYRNLESRIDQEALKKAQEILTKFNGGTKPEEPEEDDDFDLTEEEIKKMSPKEFAKWTDKRISAKATQIASKIIQQSNEVRETVKRDIREATAKHPHLKTNKQYRELVLDRIEASKARGNILSLKDACKQVDDAMGIKPGEAPKEKKPEEKKKPRTAMEKNKPGGEGAPKSDDEKVLDGILNAGGKGAGKLGGLGI